MAEKCVGDLRWFKLGADSRLPLAMEELCSVCDLRFSDGERMVVLTGERGVGLVERRDV